ncbi:MAG TPA: glycosyltransferase [Terriglobales bacterium]|jgi:glycosyltransferase involved in cell wall biosynthesis|nr:glycosyltransferase [Terriglobales bacterium]
MNNFPLVSAVIPTYNRANLVCEAVESVLQQSYRNMEVIVVDDGSTDDTLVRLQAYGDRVRVISQSNAGPAVARNRGISASKGEIVAFLDSDDLWLPNKIERQVALMERAGKSVPCCVSNITMRWTEKELNSFEIAALSPRLDEGIWMNADEVLATRFLLFNQGIAIRREVLEKIGGFDEKLWLLEDHELALRLSLEGPWAFIKDPLVIWRETRAGSLYQDSKNNDLKWANPLVVILEEHLKKVQNGNRHKRLRHYVDRELKSARRQLKAAKVSQMSFWGASFLGMSLKQVERYRKAFFVRSPWFPKMKISAL